MPVNVVHPWRLLVAAVAAAVAVSMAAPTAATALSCASHPDASPGAIAAATEELAGGGAFRERYDGAVFGTVLSVETQDDGGQPDYGRTELVVDVTGALGPEVGDRTVIVEDDPGWLNGYGFEVGAHYLIPYVEIDKGRYSHVCDPIAQVDPADVPALVELAERSGWAGSASNDLPSEQADGTPDEHPSTAGAGAFASSSGAERSWGLPLLLLLGLPAALIPAGLWGRHKGRGCE